MRGERKAMATILKGMLLKEHIGGKHTSEDNIPKHFPKHLRNHARKALKELIRMGFVIAKPTFYGKQVSINPKKSKEIKEFIVRHDSL